MTVDLILHWLTRTTIQFFISKLDRCFSSRIVGLGYLVTILVEPPLGLALSRCLLPGGS